MFSDCKYNLTLTLRLQKYSICLITTLKRGFSLHLYIYVKSKKIGKYEYYFSAKHQLILSEKSQII